MAEKGKGTAMGMRSLKTGSGIPAPHQVGGVGQARSNKE
jgi:hypothetical protein